MTTVAAFSCKKLCTDAPSDVPKNKNIVLILSIYLQIKRPHYKGGKLAAVRLIAMHF